MHRLATFVVTTALVSALGAAAPAHANVWGQQTTITGYYIYAGGPAYITTANNQNPYSCTQSTYLYLDPSATFFKEIWATVIAAQAAGSTVSIHYDGCSPDGLYPKVTSVAVPHFWP